MRTLISIPVYKKLDSRVLQLLNSIQLTADREFHLYLPVGDNSHAWNANLAIRTAKMLDCKYVMLMDSDTEWQMNEWLSRLENCLDTHNDWHLLIQGDHYDANQIDPVYGDETRNTPYTTSAFMFFRTDNNIWFDTDFLFTQSLEVDLIREYRRQGLKTGVLYSVGCIHYRRADCDEARGHCFKRYQQRNERLFIEKWGGAICHDESTVEQWVKRNQWRGIFGRKDIDNLEDFSPQFKTIMRYDDLRSPLLHNDIQYLKRTCGIMEEYFGRELWKTLSCPISAGYI